MVLVVIGVVVVVVMVVVVDCNGGGGNIGFKKKMTLISYSLVKTLSVSLLCFGRPFLVEGLALIAGLR